MRPKVGTTLLFNPFLRRLTSGDGLRRGVLTTLILWAFSLFALPVQAALPDLIAQVKGSVLPVGTFSPVTSPRFTFRGTGFVVGDGNLLVTNAHVLPEPVAGQEVKLAVQVRLEGGGQDLRSAVIVRVEASKDLALLRFEGRALQPLPLAQPTSLREGLSIAFIGYPLGGALGFSPVTHRGIVSSITPIALPMATAQRLNERSIRQIREGTFDILQLDATAYPGNSGGPVFSVDSGEVVGVINMVLIKGSRESALTHPSGISYAIPVSFVRDIVGDLGR